MFEDTLLIIKPDYLHKRKAVLLHLLSKDFQIQGQRKLQFSPEQAAEFYQENSNDKCFMLQVILLSKGVSEAFILTKENAVADLHNVMICYFTTSLEMDTKVHVTKNSTHVPREIKYIFPNYIHEPIPHFHRNKFCTNKLMGSLAGELYELTQGDDSERANWKVKLSDWLMLTNKALPVISTQCVLKLKPRHMEKSTAVNAVCKESYSPAMSAHSGVSGSKSFSLDSSMMMTTSSCITCTCFDGTDICLQPPPPPPPPVKAVESCDEMILKRIQKLKTSTLVEEEEPEQMGEEEEFEEEEFEMGDILVGEVVEETKVVEAEKPADAPAPPPPPAVEAPKPPPPPVVEEPPPPPPPPPVVEEPPPPPVVEEPPPPPPPVAEEPPPPATVEEAPPATAEEAPPAAAEEAPAVEAPAAT